MSCWALTCLFQLPNSQDALAGWIGYNKLVATNVTTSAELWDSEQATGGDHSGLSGIAPSVSPFHSSDALTLKLHVQVH